MKAYIVATVVLFLLGAGINLKDGEGFVATASLCLALWGLWVVLS